MHWARLMESVLPRSTQLTLEVEGRARIVPEATVRGIRKAYIAFKRTIPDPREVSLATEAVSKYLLLSNVLPVYPGDPTASPALTSDETKAVDRVVEYIKHSRSVGLRDIVIHFDDGYGREAWDEEEEAELARERLAKRLYLTLGSSPAAILRELDKTLSVKKAYVDPVTGSFMFQVCGRVFSCLLEQGRLTDREPMFDFVSGFKSESDLVTRDKIKWQELFPSAQEDVRKWREAGCAYTDVLKWHGQGTV